MTTTTVDRYFADMPWNPGTLRSYFSFTRKERPGIIALAILLLLTAFLPRLFRHEDPLPEPSLWARADSFAAAVPSKSGSFTGQEAREGLAGPGGFPAKRSVSLFRFDPNTLTFAEWEALGLRERTIRVILHYREKGGRFRDANDLGRIWGIAPEDVDRLKPWVRIPGERRVTSDGRRSGSLPWKSERDTNSFRDRPQVGFRDHGRRTSQPYPLPLDVNAADSLAWVSLPGIGEKLAARILNFRDKLGGFSSVEQVGETWGLSDSTFRSIRPRLQPSLTPLRKIPLNSAPEELLSRHPYIRFRLARTIVRYRQEHGPFASIEELKRIALVTDDLYVKLVPYCKLD